MATCREAIEQLVDYLHNEVEDPSEDMLMQHLEMCQLCCERLEFQQKLTAVIVDRAQIGEECPEVLRDTILEKLRTINELDFQLENAFKF